MTVGEAIERYHELLTPAVAEDSWNELNAASRKLNLAFGERLICNVLRPYFLSRTEADQLARAAAIVVSALHGVFESLRPDEYETLLGLSPAEARLATSPAHFTPAETIARLDSFWPRGGALKFIEYNAESPGGIGFGAALAGIFRRLPIVQQFSERYSLSSAPVLDHTLDALVDAYRKWGGKSAKPSIAIVDWEGARTYPEFVLCREAFESRGHPTVIADPAELAIVSGKLFCAGVETDIVYRRVVASEVAARLPQDHALVRAERERAACIASSFRALALLSKALFALISDPATSPRLSPEQRAAVERHVPWTRLARESATTTWEGGRVDLIDFALARKDDLVLKPATDYGGSGVHLGWTETSSEWEAALRTALESPSVIQRRVEIPSEQFPTFVGGSLQLSTFMADVDPYVFAGETNKGEGTRLSASDLLNVSAGGGSAVPVFVIQDR